MQRFGNVLLLLLGFGLFSAGLTLGMLNQPTIQNSIAHRLAAHFSQATGGTIAVDSVQVRFFRLVRLHNVRIKTPEGDTLLAGRQLEVNLNLLRLLTGTAMVRSALLDEGIIRLHRHPDSSNWNFAFLIEALGANTTSRRQDNQIQLGQFIVRNTHFYLADHLKQNALTVHLPYFLVDWEQTDFGRSHFLARKVFFDKPDIAFIKWADTVPQTETSAIDTGIIHLNTTDLRIRIQHLELAQARFQFDDLGQPAKQEGFDGRHQQYTHLNLKLHNGAFLYDRIEADIDHLSLQEKSGLRIAELKGHIVVTPTYAGISDLLLRTPQSLVQDSFSLSYHNFQAFLDFTNRVTLFGRLHDATASTTDLAFFIPQLGLAKEQLHMTGEITGTISRLVAAPFALRLSSGAQYAGTIQLNGLPHLRETFIDLVVSNMRFSQSDIVKLFPEITLPESVQRLTPVAFTGRFTGFLNDFVSYGTLQTRLGTLVSDLNMEWDPIIGTVRYSGSLATGQFELGKLVDAEPTLGQVRFDLRMTGQGLDIDDLQVWTDGRIDALAFNGYSYTNIEVEGVFDQRQFEGRVVMKDPHVDLVFKGLINLRTDLPTYRFRASLRNAQAHKLGLTRQPLVVGADLEINLAGGQLDNLLGTAQAHNLLMQRDQQSLFIDSLVLAISQNHPDQVRQLKLHAPQMTATIEGNFRINDLPHHMASVVHHYLPVGDKLLSRNPSPANFSYRIQTQQVAPFIQFLLPDWEGFSFVTLSGSVNTQRQSLTLTGFIPRVRYRQLDLADISLTTHSRNDSLHVEISSRRCLMGDSIYVVAPSVTATITQGRGLARVRAQNKNGRNRLDMPVAFEHQHDRWRMHILPGSFVLNGRSWELNPENQIQYYDQRLLFEQFVLQSGAMQVRLENINTRVRATNIAVSFQSFPLDDLGPLPRIGSWYFTGSLNGTVQMYNVFYALRVSAAIDVQSLGINGYLVQYALATIDYMPEYDELILNAVLHDANHYLRLTGNYFPLKTSDQLSLGIAVQNTSLHLAEHLFFQDLISKTSGWFTGNLLLEGTLDQLLLTGQATITDLRTTVMYLNTTYHAPGFSLPFHKNGIEINQIMLYDSDGGFAVANGMITHSYLKQWMLNVTVDASRFQVLNTTAAHDSLYYGTAYATGIIQFAGPAEAPQIAVNLRSERGTTINIPMYSSSSVGQYQFITFVTADRAGVPEPRTTLPEGLSMNLNLEITPDAQLRIIFDEKTGDIIEGRGVGNVQLLISNTGDFRIYGTYIIEQGQYLFTQFNFFNKYFVIKEGSTITWTGDPYQAQVNLSAIYSTRASLAGLFAASTALTEQDKKDLKQRQQVDLYLNLSGALLAPEIKFDVQLPQTSAFSHAANLELMRIRQDENELNKQVFGLLVLGQFLPTGTPQEATTNFGASVNNNLSEFIFNQLSYLASSVRSDVDLAVSYQTYQANIDPTDPEDLIRRNELQVALTKRFFNDRVSVDVGGNVDFGSGPIQQPSTGIAGDFSAEYRITPGGQLRAKVFSKSDYSVIDDRYRTRNGIGIKFSRDFNRLIDLLPKEQKP